MMYNTVKQVADDLVTKYNYDGADAALAEARYLKRETEAIMKMLLTAANYGYEIRVS